MALGAEAVRQGHQVWGLRRTGAAAMSAAGITPLLADITKPLELAALPGPFDWVVNAVSSGRGGVEDYRQVYLEGARNLVAWLAPPGLKKFVEVGSTSVYGQTDGAQVKESSPTEPVNETVETERVLLEAFKQGRFPAVILRVAGIYGPGRGHLFQQYLKNEARIDGKGERLINMIHLDDLVGIILAALKSGRPGEIYNAVDDEPVTQLHFFRWLSETLGKWLPPFAAEEADAGSKRGLTQKKVLNRKLKMELGYQFKHPTFRQGYTAEILRLDRAGELGLQPEAR
jgi:nucleoside-diphosphate-sugar epimerase